MDNLKLVSRSRSARKVEVIAAYLATQLQGTLFTVNVRFVVFVFVCCSRSYGCCYCCCLCLTIKPFAVYNHGVPLNRIKSVRQAIPSHRRGLLSLLLPLDSGAGKAVSQARRLRQAQTLELRFKCGAAAVP